MGEGGQTGEESYPVDGGQRERLEGRRRLDGGGRLDGRGRLDGEGG